MSAPQGVLQRKQNHIFPVDSGQWSVHSGVRVGFGAGVWGVVIYSTIVCDYVHRPGRRCTHVGFTTGRPPWKRGRLDRAQ
eukprot:2897778-Prymnesium_polylepis.1